jgi:Rrf2 family transcriptional regulator, nitric oxide-sensitive transcriptional repressor
MKVSAYSDYSLRLLMHAALRSPERVTIDEVAQAFGISRHHLVKIVHELGCSGYLRTYRGIGGGLTLALPTDKIRVGDIVRLGEECETVIECKNRSEGPCRIRSVCRLKGVLDEAASAFFAVLDRYSLADLVAKPSPLRHALGI